MGTRNRSYGGEPNSVKSIRIADSTWASLTSAASLHGVSVSNLVSTVCEEWLERPENHAAVEAVEKARSQYQKTLDKLSGDAP
jgi:hypothetical protein